MKTVIAGPGIFHLTCKSCRVIYHLLPYLCQGVELTESISSPTLDRQADDHWSI